MLVCLFFSSHYYTGASKHGKQIRAVHGSGVYNSNTETVQQQQMQGKGRCLLMLEMLTKLLVTVIIVYRQQKNSLVIFSDFSIFLV